MTYDIYLAHIFHMNDSANWQCKWLEAFDYYPKGAMVVNSLNGQIVDLGHSNEILKKFPDAEIIDYSNKLIIPGFIDCHVHMPQYYILGSYGHSLLKWLDTYTFPEETKFADEKYANQVIDRFISQLIKSGTTTAAIYSSSHYSSTNLLFKKANDVGLRAIIGKVTMDQNCPDAIKTTPGRDCEESKELIKNWHGKNGKLFYALTPRFAPSVTKESFVMLQKLRHQFPDCYVQTHISETLEEIKFALHTHPDFIHYLDIYNHYDLVDSKTILGHGIYTNPLELNLLAKKGASIAHCPSSNLFLGSGLFSSKMYIDRSIPLGMASDIGGGTNLMIFKNLEASYFIHNLTEQTISPLKLFYFATMASAQCLSLDDEIGNFNIGKKADFQVINPYKNNMLGELFDRRQDDPEALLQAFYHLSDPEMITAVYSDGKLIS